MNDYQKLIAASRYARWRESDGRREFWDETVARLTWYWADKGLITSEEARELYDAIYNLRVMPSMRSLMTAGEALDRDNMAGYNCSYIHVDHPRAFDEIMYVLMCGRALVSPWSGSSLTNFPKSQRRYTTPIQPLLLRTQSSAGLRDSSN